MQRLLTLSLALALAGTAHAEFRAGAYAIDITPPNFPISVNGNMQDVLATGSHDTLHARCLVLDDGKHKIAFVVVDSCMIPRELIDDAKALAAKSAGIPTECILISATHCHSAPTLGGVFQSEPDAGYVKFLAKRIAEGITTASKNLEPAELAWAVGRAPNQVFNRRWKMKPGSIPTNPFGSNSDLVQMNPGYQNPGLVEPAGPTDPEVTVLALRAVGGRPMALFANYSLHYVGGVKPLSADYFGAFAERVKQLLDGDEKFVGAMSNGTSGDVNNIDFGSPAPPAPGPSVRIRVVADDIAKVAVDALKGAKWSKDVTLASAERELELGVRLPSEGDIAYATKLLAEAKGPPYLKMPEIYARETLLVAKYPKTVRAKLQAHRVGEVGVCAIPCEVFTEIGLSLKKQSPLKPTFTVSLANGYNGYLPTPEQHQLGGYETWRARSSYLETGASPKIEAALLDLLKQVQP